MVNVLSDEILKSSLCFIVFLPLVSTSKTTEHLFPVSPVMYTVDIPYVFLQVTRFRRCPVGTLMRLAPTGRQIVLT